MTSLPDLLDRDALRTTFETWTAAEESLDSQLSESLSALAAFQSHLDAWQQRLIEERNALDSARQQLEREQVAASSQATHSADSESELSSAQQKITDLTACLVARTEELRDSGCRHAELVAELDLARSHATELESALETQRQTHDEQRAKWNDDLQSLRENSGHPEVTPIVNAQESAPPVPAATVPPRSSAATNRDRTSNSAVLGSIVEQFGKLRQQRAVDRQSQKKSR